MGSLIPIPGAVSCTEAPSSRPSPLLRLPASRPEEDQPRIGLLNRLFNSKPAYRVEDPPANVGRPKVERSQRNDGNQRVERKKKPRAPRTEGAEPPQVAVITKRPDARSCSSTSATFSARVWPRA